MTAVGTTTVGLLVAVIIVVVVIVGVVAAVRGRARRADADRPVRRAPSAVDGWTPPPDGQTRRANALDRKSVV